MEIKVQAPTAPEGEAMVVPSVVDGDRVQGAKENALMLAWMRSVRKFVAGQKACKDKSDVAKLKPTYKIFEDDEGGTREDLHLLHDLMVVLREMLDWNFALWGVMESFNSAVSMHSKKASGEDLAAPPSSPLSD